MSISDLDSSSYSEPTSLSTSLGVIDLHTDSTGGTQSGGNVSPIPFDDHNGSGQQMTTSLPPVSALYTVEYVSELEKSMAQIELLMYVLVD